MDLFVPNVCAIDMDTTGTWPFGGRLEDQVATRFLSLFLDMDATLNGKPYHIETAERPGAVGPGADRAEDPAEPAARTTSPSSPSSPTSPSHMPPSAYERDVEAVERDLAALAEEPPGAARSAGIASRLTGAPP